MTDEETMALCAIQYTIGRMSYIVADGVRWARKYGAQSRHIRHIIIRDIESKIKGGLPFSLGAENDEQEWRAVLAELKEMEDHDA